MQDADKLAALARADRAKAEKEYARGRGMMQRAEADIRQADAFLEGLARYGAIQAPVDYADISRRSAERMAAYIRRGGGKARAIVDAAIGHINAHGPTNLSVLIDVVKASGLEIGGNEKARMAGYMSKDKRVYFQAPNGWFVSDAKTNNGPDAHTNEVSDPSSLFSNEGGPHGTALASE